MILLIVGESEILRNRQIVETRSEAIAESQYAQNRTWDKRFCTRELFADLLGKLKNFPVGIPNPFSSAFYKVALIKRL